MRRALLSVALAAPSWLGLTACQGDGSDIGPRLERLPDLSFQVVVLDDQDRAVSGARVSVAGHAGSAVTGRAGRANLRADLRGARRIRVDAGAASATDADRLVSLGFVCDLLPGEPPAPIHLPDTAGSPELTLAAGAQPSAVVLGAGAAHLATLSIAAGSAVSDGAAGSVTLRWGALASHHLPWNLPAASAGALLVGAGIHLDPVTAELAPAATLRMLNDLQVPDGTPVMLLHLDPDLGTWRTAASGVAQGSDLVAAGVARGGLYAFAVEIASTAVVTGRVVDAAGRAVDGALVRVDAMTARTASDGRFALAGLAAVDGAGTPRTVVLQVRGGHRHLPVAVQASATLAAGGSSDVGDVALTTTFAGDLRALQVVRSRAAPFQRCGIGSLDGNVARVGLADAEGVCVLEDIPAGYFGFTQGLPIDGLLTYRSDGIGFLAAGRSYFDIQQFHQEHAWVAGTRSARVRVVDEIAGGPMRAAIVEGARPGAGLRGVTREAGVLFVGRRADGRATAAAATASDGRTVTAAFSVVRPDSEFLDLPLARADRAPPGRFDRHGLVRGTVAGADPTAERRLRATRLLAAGEWYDAVLQVRSVASALPVKADAADPTAAFRVGVGQPAGNVCVVQGSITAGRFTMERMGLLAGLVVPDGTEQVVSLALDAPADTAHTLPAALDGLHGGIAVADLRVDLGLQRPDATVVDAARDLGGNHAAAGQDLRLMLPDLAGPRAGHQWLVCVTAAAAAVPGVAQRTVHRLAGPTGAAVSFLGVPDITEPADGATVAADGFRVGFAVPAGTTYLTLELQGELGGDTRVWRVVLPPEPTTFDFVRLPAEVPTPLLAGRSYTLTLTAWRIDAGPIAQRRDIYAAVTGFWFGIDAAERGVTAASSRTITVALQ